ncbi:Pr6Pr family membrane protein [Catenovulum sp. SM1970]|uniref:Pr6Pr family membrane protein n=1 Tax=Marinifaba aquimaris TaxID=2741323 RepID=UPI00157289A5|nr:Pr6Pr family membrane protein [Marinifaba aquimaris]NTS78374.1 Pr6Pr family membrane protein [Marinifaba aquimaris]
MNILLILTVLSAATGVLTGYYTTYLDHADTSLLMGFWQLNSYFTLWTNTLVFVASTTLLLFPKTHLGQWFAKPTIFAAIAFYIAIVGIGNYLIFPFKPLVDIYALSDFLVHALTPILFFSYWLFSANKHNIKVGKLHYWLLYPWSYVLYTSAHISWSGFSPYPFTNIKTLGLANYILNAVVLSLLVLAASYGFIKLIDIHNQQACRKKLPVR